MSMKNAQIELADLADSLSRLRSLHQQYPQLVIISRTYLTVAQAGEPGYLGSRRRCKRLCNFHRLVRSCVLSNPFGSQNALSLGRFTVSVSLFLVRGTLLGIACKPLIHIDRFGDIEVFPVVDNPILVPSIYTIAPAL